MNEPLDTFLAQRENERSHRNGAYWTRVQHALDMHAREVGGIDGTIGEVAIQIDIALLGIMKEDDEAAEPRHQFDFTIKPGKTKITGKSLAILICLTNNLRQTDLRQDEVHRMDLLFKRIEENIHEYDDEFDTQIEFKIKYIAGEHFDIWVWDSYRYWGLKATFGFQF